MIPQLPFGRTGHQSSQVLFGAAALGAVSQQDADRAMETILRFGVNHIDTAASYGEAEVRLAPWMKRARAEFFLATKTEKRTYPEARDQIQKSLERLQTNQVDLLQLHAVVEDAEWEAVFAPGGALEAAVEAKAKGYTRFVGITSHSLNAPRLHLKSLERYAFDSVLVPWNYMLAQNAQYAADFHALTAVCRQKGTALQLIKSNQKAKWKDGEERFASTWYVPFSTQQAVDQAIGWVLGNQPQAFLPSSGDVTVLPLFLEAVNRFDPKNVPTDRALEELVRREDGVPLWP